MSHSHTAIHVASRREPFHAPRGIRSAVSLHSHSNCSRESLDFLPDFARSIPIVADLFERGAAAYAREHQHELDLGQWYWRPPMPPGAVVDSECEHIERRLDRPALVSLTDHDTAEGPVMLRAAGRCEIPISLEWTVPFHRGEFHIGVHGIPSSSADAIAQSLNAYTTGHLPARDEHLADLLEWLGECPDTLVVLNHPYWDLGRIGQMRHDSTLLAFLRIHRDRIHALELNGYRTWTENRRVLPLARGFDLPVVGGGDRHGLTPNMIVNLTRASCFDGFVRELRVERTAHCIVFPEYAEPFAARCLQTADDILRPERCESGERRTWAHRVFTTTDGREQSVAGMWARAPRWLDATVGVTRLLGASPLSLLLGIGRSDGYELLHADCGAHTVFDAVPEPAAGSVAAA
ncbi:MAG: PHP domain-containing protein [Vicinamibacterales bacterium]